MGESGGSFSNLFEESEFGDPNQLAGASSPEDLFSILEILEGAPDFNSLTSFDETTALISPKLSTTSSTNNAAFQEYSEMEADTEMDIRGEAEASDAAARKRRKLSETTSMEDEETNPDGQPRMTHIAVERNRRKQMNENLSVLRSLMPCFYVKRGDQASIIGGVVDYITELQQVLKSLEAKKQRKVYSEVLSPRVLVSAGSPRPLLPLSPRKPPPPPSPLSPRLNLPISPRTPQPGSPYMSRMQQPSGYLSPTTTTMTTNNCHEPSPTCSSSSSSLDNVKELAANSKSIIADVEVKFSGTNVLLKTISPRIPGQVVKIIAALEGLALEILNVRISVFDDTMLNSFTIKIGFECELSAEELAHEIQQTFS
ncbi:transcription factor SPEECHLESS-like [Telopea speciosissima]|uniref:transcription factor SPEECHLESS-like n=1 Tax=Telopea speciosissima TaxID=54955 RepID=UPI001CC603F1|nr:transcription factor SPEECHLESS-like [Telopea speciosissima]